MAAGGPSMALPGPSVIVVAVAWCSVAIAIVAVVIRGILKRRLVRHIGADDVFIWTGLVCYIGFCVTMHLSAEYGLGMMPGQITDEMNANGMKVQYVSYLLYMPTIATAKLSVVSVLRKCALNKRDRLLLYLFEWVLAVWIFLSECVKTFQCSEVAPWAHFNVPCIDADAWCVFFMLFNCFTELWLIVIPTLNIFRLPTTWDKKCMAIAIFSLRILIVPASIMVIVTWIRGTSSDTPSYTLYPFLIWVAVTALHEILSACVLYVRPVFEVLELGFTAIPPERRGSSTVGLCAKGSWPFTHISTLEELLTNRATTYHVNVHADKDHDEGSHPVKENGTHIHVSEKVFVHRSQSTCAEKFKDASVASIITESQLSDM